MNDQTQALHVPPQHPCYDGHFPGNPIVPGALLLQWLLGLVENAYPERRVVEVSSIKFVDEVKPGDHLQVRFNPVSAAGKLTLTAHRANTQVCKATFIMLQSRSG